MSRAAAIGGRILSALRARPTRVADLGLALLVLVLLSDLVFQGRVLYERDILLFWYTQVESFVRIVASPAWPLWDRWTAFGQPLLADPSAQILYPFTWLNLLMPPWVYYTVLVVSHVWFSGAGLYRFGLALRLSRLAAFTAAALWILSGPLLSVVNVTHHFTGACWIPWVLLAAERAACLPSRRRIVVWALAASAQVVAGSADMCALTVLATAALLAKHVAWRRPLLNLHLLGTTLAAAGLTLGLTSLLWWPALEVALRSARENLPEFHRIYWSLHPLSLIELVFPVGDRNLPVSPALRALLYEGREPFLGSIYLGLPTAVLLVAGFATRERRLLAAILAAGAVALLFALGGHTPFYDGLVALLPFLRVFRYPQKALVLVGLCVALGAGLGLDVARAGDELRRGWRLVMRGAALALVGLGLAGVLVFTLERDLVVTRVIGGTLPADRWRPTLDHVAVCLAGAALLAGVAALPLFPLWRRLRRAHVVALAGGCAVLALLAQQRHLNPTTRAAFYRHRPPALAYLSQTSHERLYSYDYLYTPSRARAELGPAHPYSPVRLPQGLSPREAFWLSFREALAPPLAGVWGRESSYDMDYRGLYSREQQRLVNAVLDAEKTPALLRFLRLGAVSRVVALHTRGLEDLTPVATLPSLTSHAIHIFAVPGPLPRCYVVGGTRIADGDEATQLLGVPAFDPTREIVLPTGAPVAAPPGFSGTCRIDELRPDATRLEIEASDPAHVVLVDGFDPGWQATVDGRPAEVLRANVGFQAVEVPAGAHRVALRYRPRGVRLGILLSGAALALAVVLSVGRWPARRTAASAAQEEH